MKRAYDSKEFQDFMKARGFTPVWGDAEAYEKFMKKNNEEIGEVMKALGLRG